MKKIFVAFFILSFFLVSAPVQAQNPEPLNCDENICFTPQITIPGTDIKAGQTIKIGGDTIGKYLLALYTFGIYAAGIVATIVIMAGGFVWLMAGGNTSQVEQARTMIKGAITGYVLLLLSWVLLNTINPNLTRFESLYIEPVGNVVLDDSSKRACCYFPAEDNSGVLSQSECEYISFITVGTCDCEGQISVVHGAKECADLGSSCIYKEGSEGKQLAEAKKVCDTTPVLGSVRGLNNQVFISDCQQVGQCKDLLRDSGRLGRCSSNSRSLTGSGCDNGYVCNNAWSCEDSNDSGSLKAGAGGSIDVPSGGGFGCCKPRGIDGDVCVDDGHCANGYTCWGAGDPQDYWTGFGVLPGSDTVTLGECRKL